MVSSNLLILLGALGLGAAHAFEPDHMAAVSTFVAKKPSPCDAAMFGVNWAIGHGFSLLVFGTVLYFLKSMLEHQQPRLFSSGVLDRAVGVVLIALGIWTLLQERVLERMQAKKHAALHQQIHLEAETQNVAARDQKLSPSGSPEAVETHAILSVADLPKASRVPMYTHTHTHTRGSLLMGMLHGAAGTGAFVVQAANAGIANSYAMVFGFTVLFSIGVLGSMALYAAMLGGAISWGGTRGARFVRGARFATGVLACVVGVCMLMAIDIPWVHLA